MRSCRTRPGRLHLQPCHTRAAPPPSPGTRAQYAPEPAVSGDTTLAAGWNRTGFYTSGAGSWPQVGGSAPRATSGDLSGPSACTRALRGALHSTASSPRWGRRSRMRLSSCARCCALRLQAADGGFGLDYPYSFTKYSNGGRGGRGAAETGCSRDGAHRTGWSAHGLQPCLACWPWGSSRARHVLFPSPPASTADMLQGLGRSGFAIVTVDAANFVVDYYSVNVSRGR